MIIVLYLSTILTEKGLDENKTWAHWKSSLGMLKNEKNPNVHFLPTRLIEKFYTYMY